MREQGMQDQEITNTLTQEGVSPKEIQDSFSQAQIKNAVAGTPEAPQPNEDTGYAPQTYSEETQDYPTQEMYPQEGGYDDYGGSQPTGSDNTIEIAQQVFSDKIRKTSKQLSELKEFKTLGGSKIQNISERLTRIENIIDKLQISILEKVGSYGQNLNSIKKEMGMMQDSFSKVIKKHKKSK